MATTTTAQLETLFRRLAKMPADGLLRMVLKIDAGVTALNGLAYVAAADLLDEPLGISAALLRPVGASLLVFAGSVYYLATRRSIRPNPVRLVIALNALWVLDSLVALVAGWLTPTTAGAVWVVAQAAVVGGFAALQHRGLVSRSAQP